MWSDPNRPEGLNPYFTSKVKAERAAWDFVDALDEGESF